MLEALAKALAGDSYSILPQGSQAEFSRQTREKTNCATSEKDASLQRLTTTLEYLMINDSCHKVRMNFYRSLWLVSLVSLSYDP